MTMNGRIKKGIAVTMLGCSAIACFVFGFCSGSPTYPLPEAPPAPEVPGSLVARDLLLTQKPSAFAVKPYGASGRTPTATPGPVRNELSLEAGYLQKIESVYSEAMNQ